jgi:L-serine dehydratase
MRLMGADGSVLFEREYYSPGGGFLQWKGQPAPERGAPVHPFGSMAAFKALVRDTGKPLHQLMLENEQAVMGCSEKTVNEKLDQVVAAMAEGVKLGLKEEGVLPGPFEMFRKARRIHEQARKMKGGDAFLQQVSSYALAVSEGNAAGRLAVTAPTLGSAGTMPAVVYVMREHLKLSREAMRRGLLAAGLVGLLCKTNAAVAGAEVGGFVLIPCIERNAFGALKAYNAQLMADSEIASQHWEDLDRGIAAMLETGKALPPQFREMGTGGLGVSMMDC